MKLLLLLLRSLSGRGAQSWLAEMMGLKKDGEAALIVRHLQGHGDAFPALMKQYQSQVYAYLARCGVRAGVRDDLFQEVFLKVHAKAATYRSERPFEPWFFAIVANTVRDHFRSRHALNGHEELNDVASSEPNSFDNAAARETQEWLELALTKLSRVEREVVLLCGIRGLEQKDVANILGIPLGTVKTHLRRGRIALAQAWKRRSVRAEREVPR